METKNIRNICLIGHGNTGKTSLAESMLYVTGAIDRMGRVSDGNTVCDYDAEEIARQITISTAVAPVNFGGCKINVLDCPGYFDFVGDVLCALRAVEAGVIVVSAKDTAETVAVGAPSATRSTAITSRLSKPSRASTAASSAPSPSPPPTARALSTWCTTWPI